MQALQSGGIAGAALDVYEREPLAAANVAAPKRDPVAACAGMGRSRLQRFAALCADNAVRLSRGQPLAGGIDVPGSDARRAAAAAPSD